MEIQPRESGLNRNYQFQKSFDASPSDPNGFVAVYLTHPDAEAAVRKLQQAGFDMKKLSIIGQDYRSEENIVGYYNIGDRMKYWGKLGAFWGALWGILFGSAIFVVPGFGPLIVAGSFASALLSAAEGSVVVGGLSAVGVALFNAGIPQDSIVEYETALKAGKYVMIAHGTEEDVKTAREMVKNFGASDMVDFKSNVEQDTKGLSS